MEGDEEVALSKGMDAYVTKPQSMLKVRDALTKVGIHVEAGRPAVR